jgi:hypothetical protein
MGLGPIARSIGDIIKEANGYMPGYRLRMPPMLEGDKVAVIIEVEGAGDFCLNMLEILISSTLLLLPLPRGSPTGLNKAGGMKWAGKWLLSTPLSGMAAMLSAAEDVRRYIGCVLERINVPVGFHAHNNLSLAVANTLAAIETGCGYIDAALRCLGAGAGNTQLEILAAILERQGCNTGFSVYGLMDLAQEVVEPMMRCAQAITTSSLMLGYAGVYSSFLLHVNSAEKFGVEARDILTELGRRRIVGGQEDMIIDVAYAISRVSS